jgi:cytidylate kinase
LIITIDGPAGSGKSAAAELLAQRLALRHLDTGAMYRAVALEALRQDFSQNSQENRDNIGRLVTSLNLNFDWLSHPAKVLLNGQDVSLEIRKPEVTAFVYMVADNVAVRTNLVQRQREIAAETGSLVTEGRDQGTLVFPDADFKFYLEADIRERVKRRLAEFTRKGIAIDASELLKDMAARDQRDKSRAVGALKLAGDAIVLETTNLTLAEVVEAMVRITGSKTHG